MDTSNIQPPGEVIAAALERTADADRAWWAAREREAPSSEVERLWQNVEILAAEHTALRNQARRVFAESRGWTYNPRSWYGNPPIIDHAEFYDGPYRREVALVSHAYATHEKIAKFAETHRLKAEILPWSWWNPRGCTAVLFTTLPLGSEWPWRKAPDRHEVLQPGASKRKGGGS